MLVSMYCTDNPGSDGRRQTNLQAHLAYIENILDKIRVAGPLMNDAGERPVGSLLIVEVDTLAEAREILECDPYFEAGVWSAVSIEPFLGVAGEWVGGKSW